jgi:tetratricopeptide (TPR) repeat protein
MIRESPVRRPFAPARFGEAIEAMAPDRRVFLDRRWVDPERWRALWTVLENPDRWENLVRRYDLDGCLLPAPELDRRWVGLHDRLWRDPRWALVYFDHRAFLYVDAGRVDSTWVARRAYRLYHTMTFQRTRFPPERWERLREELERATTEDSSGLIVWIDRGTVCEWLERWDEAIEAFERARRIEPDNPYTWYRLALAAMRAERWELAERRLRHLVAMDSTVPFGPFYLGEALRHRGRLGGADSAYAMAARIDPNFAAAYVEEFRMWAAESLWNRALAVAKRFHRARPYDYRSSAFLARAHLALSRFEEAREEARRAVRLDPGNPQLHLLMGDVFRAVGERDSAIASWRRALELDSDLEAARDRLREVGAAPRVERGP